MDTGWDKTLYEKLHQKCNQIKPFQCLHARPAADVSNRDIEKYDSRCTAELTFFWQMLRLQCKYTHTLIPRIVCIWRDNLVFYIQSESTAHMVSLAEHGTYIPRHMLIGLLIDLVYAVRVIHSEGVYHGLLHESSIRIDIGGVGAVHGQLVGFADRVSGNEGAFHVQRKRDVDMMRAMFARLMVRFNIDLSTVVAHMFDPSIDNTYPIIAELRSMLATDAREIGRYVCGWQTMLAHHLLHHQKIHEVVLADIPHKGKTEQALQEFTAIFTHGRDCLPIFVNANTIERGRSTWIPIVHEFIDWMTNNKYLVRHADVIGVIPNNTKLLLTDHTKMVYVFAGYLLAYTFFLDLPLNCAFSKMLVQFVMDSNNVKNSTSNVYVCSPAEKKIINTIKHHICYMRVGAMCLTSLSVYTSFSIYPSRLYDHHFNVDHVNVPINALSYDCFDIHCSLTPNERQTVMQWIKSLTGRMADAVTKFVTNSPRVSIVNTIIKLGRTDGDALVACTCDKQLLLPSAWLVNANVLHTQMTIQLAGGVDDSSSGVDRMDINFNTI